MTEQPEHKYKILLVEDEPNISTLFKYTIIKAGWDCVTAEDGAIGLEKAKETQPDLIISDIMMPNVDGFEFRKNILEEPSLKKIPFVFLTAVGEDDKVLEGYELDIEEYIIKTAPPKIVIAKLKAILNSLEKERNKILGEVQQAAGKTSTQLFPDKINPVAGFEIEAWHKDYEGIPGGDFLDYIEPDENNILILLGDTMGKKWGAWYFAVAYAGYVRSAVRFVVDSIESYTPAKILEKVNSAIFKDERIAEVFITLSIIQINKKTKEIKYAGAGDLPLIFKGAETKVIKSNGMLLGVKDKITYEDVSFNLESGEAIFMLTDGIIETQDGNSNTLELPGLIELIKALDSNLNLLTQLKNKFEEFSGSKIDDDISIVMLKSL